MLIILSILLAVFLLVVLFLTLPVRIAGTVSGDLYNGSVGIDAKVLPFGGAFGGGVLRPEGGSFSVWLYLFGYRLLKIPLPRGTNGDGDESGMENAVAEYEIDEAIEPVDLDEAGRPAYHPEPGGTARVEPGPLKKSGDTGARKDDADTGAGKSTGSGTKKPKKPLMERLRGIRANIGKYWNWAKTALDDLWYIVRIRLLSGQVTVGLVNHPATVGSIMGIFAAVNAVLPKPFRISVRAEFTRTALDGRIEAEVVIYLHRIWITLFRRRKMILDIWRERRGSKMDEADVIGVTDAGTETEQDSRTFQAV